MTARIGIFALITAPLWIPCMIVGLAIGICLMGVLLGGVALIGLLNWVTGGGR